jgi:RHS repeat-associated protein
MLSLSVNTNNQVTNTGFSYDAAGDVTNDGVYTCTWNAAQHLKSAASVTYTYDGDLRRVEKSSGTLYWYTPAGVPLAETDTSGNTLNEYVFFGSARVARRDSSGNVYYYFEDHLGTATTLSNASGALCYDADFLPFGYENAYVTSCAQNYKFTGLERDGETGLDHTLNRKYDSSLGRWLTPDPKRGNVASPQSLNRYAYVLNNPLVSTDPLGLQCTPGALGYENDCPEPPEPSGGGTAGGGGSCVFDPDTNTIYCGAGGYGGSAGPEPCSNIVTARGLRPNLSPCGAGGGRGRTKKIPASWVPKGANFLKTFSTSSSACQSDLAALGLKATDVQNCASNTLMINALTQAGVMASWPTGADFLVKVPLGSNTPAIYYDALNFWQTSFAQLLGTLLHEYAHVENMNATDASLQQALGLPVSKDTANISAKLATDCFSGVENPTQ